MPSPALYPDWFDSPEDDLHSSALTSIETIWDADSELGATVAQLRWVGDGITGPERQLLEEIAGLVVQHPDLAGKVLEYPWIATGDLVGPDAVTAVGAVRAAAAVDPELARLLAGYAWLQDDVTSIETEALDAIGTLALAAGPANASSLQELVERSWLTGGVHSADLNSLDTLLELLEAAGPQNSGILEELVGYSWLTDGITEIERSALHHIRQMLANPWAVDSGIVEQLVSYSWVADGINSGELNDLRYLSNLLATAEAENSGPVATLLGYSWVSNGIRSRNWYDLLYFTELLERVGDWNAGRVETVVGYRWIADGIFGSERGHLRRVNELLDTPGAEECGLGETLAGYSWLADRITDAERDGLHGLIGLLMDAGVTHCASVEKLVAYSWVADGITWDERDAQYALSGLLSTRGPTATGGVETLVGYEWVADGVTEVERSALWAFRGLLESAGAENSEAVETLMGYDWVADGITPFESSALNRLGQLLDDADAELTGRPWFDDGIDEEELPFLIVLHDAKSRSIHQYQDLLDSHHIRSKTISLPLAGDVKLWVFRHSPFPPDDDSIELMEAIMPVLEEFMEVPFPWNPVVLSIIEPSLRAGEEPGRAGAYALQDQLAIAGREYNQDFHLSVFHEISHIYWGGHTGAPIWFTEGAAQFLPDYARELLGVQTMEERRKELMEALERDCLEQGVENIRRLLELSESGWNPDDYLRIICHYWLGEFFLMETYRLLGHDATSAAMRELYLENEATGVDISERHIYQAFLSNAPPAKVDAFRELYGRIHGGTYDDG